MAKPKEDLAPGDELVESPVAVGLRLPANLHYEIDRDATDAKRSVPKQIEFILEKFYKKRL